MSESTPTLPSATGDFGDKPELTFPDAAPPEELVVEVLTAGSGLTVESGQTIEVNYFGQIWGGRVFDNSYDRGSSIEFPIGMGVVIHGWDAGLVGRAIGSRLLLSIPPHDGYGPGGAPRAGIGGDDTLVFVVDILGSH
ncbi:FKBP-type peptidyl-prolyl cis-trans isomerase [Pseudactinotalea sp. HY160]|uniref:FKBP-type peptidyl-prolyl cis-trans isomerase n=1 Tax=Pseudactinotalea sp. HY160 TaxID=2654490 RepID=UPI00128E0DD4|nr:FKBP-type peptidyl-prolyl cis-trans isomerase [Pseudactinotalea sp. HY160]MPV48720.1 FKBP-type peptidyl-prolyl cis-trans isomerase [Pseudactinotalea sp. HY160]